MFASVRFHNVDMQQIGLPPEAARLLERATRHTTPCGDGEMVWHSWGSGEPLVMLHGGSGSWTHWVRNIEAVVAAGRVACVPDLPGFGDSASAPAGVNADAGDVVEPVASGLRELFGDGPFDIIAFSFGSLVAALMAAQQPALVRRLLIVGAPVTPLPRGSGVDLKPWSRQASVAERMAIHRHNLLAIMLSDERLIDDDLLALQALNVERDRMRRRRLVTTDAFGNALKQMQCPYDAIYGEEDALYVHVWPQVRATLSAGPAFGQMMVIPAVGHWVQFEAAPVFNEEMVRWLSDHP